jgi:hypothetical protein
MNQVDRFPIFIIGASRSGTTLLRLMLNSHPAIHIPPEAWFLGDLVTLLPSKGLLDENQLVRAKEIILRNERWKDWNCDEDRLDFALQNNRPKTLKTLIQDLFEGCSQAKYAKIWGEKSPRHSFIAEKLYDIFPESRFIHLIRDGKDACSSMLSRGWYDKNFVRICEHWKTLVDAALQGRKFEKNRYFEIYYEKLICEPKETLSKACGFLGIDFSEAMLDYQSRIKEDIVLGEKNLHSSLLGEINVAKIGKNAKELNLFEKTIFEIICGNTYTKAGYALEPNSLIYLIKPVVFIAIHFKKFKHFVSHRLSRLNKNSNSALIRPS